MKPAPRTLIERLGFSDPDRLTPLHDEIQLWLLDNAAVVIKSLSSVEKQIGDLSVALEYPISQIHYSNNKSVIGFVDVYATGKIFRPGEQTCTPFYVSFEVKGKIHSCGDLIRQINFYRKCEPGPTVWVVVSPDDRYKTTLLSQNIYFYKYKLPGELF